jgi:uncharacterized membrane protein YraQ (UPF0718 family)
VSEPAPLRSANPRPWFDWSLAILLALAIAGAFLTWRRQGIDGVWRILGENTQLLVLMLPKIALATLMGALVRRLLPRHLIVRWVGEGSGITGIVIATMAGMILPGGPFTIFPVAAAFLAAGADRGTVIAFISAFLLNGGVRTIIWELPFFGADVVGLRLIVAIWVPVALGLAARVIGRRSADEAA